MGTRMRAHSTAGRHWVYPVAFRDVARTLRAFPVEHRRLVREVRLSFHRGGAYGRGRNGVVDLNCGMLPSGVHLLRPRRDYGVPDCARRFGAYAARLGGRVYEVWEREDFRRYILTHILPHEVAHLVLEAESWRRRDPGADERYCEEYAWRMEARLTAEDACEGDGLA